MDRKQVQTIALNSLIENEGGTIVLSPGTGKSKVAIDYMRHINAEFVLITSPRTNLIQSWESELTKWGFTKLNETNKWKDNKNKKNVFITIVNIQTCYKWDNVELSKYNLIIMDEIHTMATERYGELARRATRLGKKLVGLTGTPDDRKNDKKVFYYLYCPIVYRYTNSAVDGIINKRRYIVYEYPLNNMFTYTVNTKNGSWEVGEKKQYDYLQSKVDEAEQSILENLSIDEIDIMHHDSINYFGYAKSWYWNGTGNKQQKEAGRKYMKAINDRMNFLWNLESTCSLATVISDYITTEYPKEKVLVFSERTEQAEKISLHTVHSKNDKELNQKNLELFDKGEINQLGSCYSLTLGLNLIGTKYAIMESYNSSSVQFKQRSGRVDRLPVDEDAVVIFIVVLDTQAEKWFKQAVTFREDEEVYYVDNIIDLQSKIDEYEN